MAPGACVKKTQWKGFDFQLKSAAAAKRRPSAVILKSHQDIFNFVSAESKDGRRSRTRVLLLLLTCKTSSKHTADVPADVSNLQT